jgi:hypothetical protein
MLSTRTIASEPDIHSIQKILVAERLREKLDGAALHRLHGHRNVAMPGDEDDRESDAPGGEISLKSVAELCRMVDKLKPLPESSKTS